MKIGVLTYHAACNFGANLQTLSTVCYLKNKGYEVVVLDWMIPSLESYYHKITPPVQYEAHKNFRQSFFPMSKRCETESDIACVIDQEQIDAVIVGSDAVMQHHPFWSRIVFPTKKIVQIRKIGLDRLCPNPFWGSFLEYTNRKIPLCFMSGSSQNSAFMLMSKKERLMMNSCLERFCYVSVRDEWTAEMVRFVSDGKCNPKVTPDPVFAFNYNVMNQPFEDVIKQKYGLDGKYCLFSFHNSNAVSEQWLREIASLFEKEGIECVAFPFPSGVTFEHPFKKQIDLPLDPLDWYALIKYSSGYIGHNMHPIVVSLHNCVPCFSFDNYGTTKFRIFVNEKSSKIYHIMDSFGILSNRVCSHRFSKAPKPKYVFDAIMNFDFNTVQRKRDVLLNSYKEMMDNIEKSIRGAE